MSKVEPNVSQTFTIPNGECPQPHTGLKIILKRWPDKMSGGLNFWSDIVR